MYVFERSDPGVTPEIYQQIALRKRPLARVQVHDVTQSPS